jgi:hypothetical protein
MLKKGENAERYETKKSLNIFLIVKRFLLKKVENTVGVNCQCVNITTLLHNYVTLPIAEIVTFALL